MDVDRAVSILNDVSTATSRDSKLDALARFGELSHSSPQVIGAFLQHLLPLCYASDGYPKRWVVDFLADSLARSDVPGKVDRALMSFPRRDFGFT